MNTRSSTDVTVSYRLISDSVWDISLLDIQGGPKSKPLPNDEKIVLNRIKACQ